MKGIGAGLVQSKGNHIGLIYRSSSLPPLPTRLARLHPSQLAFGHADSSVVRRDGDPRNTPVTVPQDEGDTGADPRVVFCNPNRRGGSSYHLTAQHLGPRSTNLVLWRRRASVAGDTGRLIPSAMSARPHGHCRSWCSIVEPDGYDGDGRGLTSAQRCSVLRAREGSLPLATLAISTMRLTLLRVASHFAL